MTVVAALCNRNVLTFVCFDAMDFIISQASSGL